MDTPDPGPGLSLADYINQTYNNPVNSVNIDWRSPEQKKQSEQDQAAFDNKQKLDSFNQKYGGGGDSGGHAGPVHQIVGAAIAGGVASAAAGGSFAAGALGAI